MANRTLIIVAHGSRRASSNEEVMLLGQKVKALTDREYAFVMTSFLEFAAPSLEESIFLCIDKGADEIVILPYFLASGNHVTKDIPKIVNSIQTSYPQLKIILKDHIGSSGGMVKLLSDMAQ